jgi:hypothetical protein
MQFLSKLWSVLKSLPASAWGAFVVLVSVLVAFFAVKEKNEAETALEHAEADKTDAVLEEKQRGIRVEEGKVVAEGEAQKNDVPKTPEELAKDTSNI